MAIQIKAFANSDDALIVWRPKPWNDQWVGFALWRRDDKTQTVTAVNNRIPASRKSKSLPDAGISSALSPIRRLMWVDHGVNDGDRVSYRVVPMIEQGGGYLADEPSASPWSAGVEASGAAGEHAYAVFNRGTLMSQVVSRFLKGEITVANLKKFKNNLANAGNIPRRYLSGQLRHRLMRFLGDAEARGSEIFAALYEVNDEELIGALKAFGNRGHVLLGNGSSMKKNLNAELKTAGLEIKRRDLSKKGASSPSVHNKFLVEVPPGAGPARILTGSTNWTTTGLCTQLNNAIIVDDAAIAARFHEQWKLLVKAGDNMPASLKAKNAVITQAANGEAYFCATAGEADLAPVTAVIDGAEQGLFYLMYTPGQSPILNALLDKSQGPVGPYVRGVISEVRESATGKIVENNVRVVRKGEEETFRETALLPSGVPKPKTNVPSWAKEEIARKMFFPAGMNAIVHSKVIVADPFSENCAVVAGSHNFSTSASAKNDENVVIVRGNKRLALLYALHIQSVYDHYAWRAFLNSGGEPDKVFDGLMRWKPGGAKHRDVDFWLDGHVTG